MALEKVGVEFVSEGFSQFLRDLSEGAKAVSRMQAPSEQSLNAMAALDESMTTSAKTSGVLKNALDKLSDSVRELGESSNKVSFKKSFSGIFEGVGGALSAGAMIGGVLGTAIGPPIGNAIGAIGGAIIAAFAKLQINVAKAVIDFLKSISDAALGFLPEVVRDLAKVGESILKVIGSIVKSIWGFAGEVGSGILAIFGIKSGSLGDTILGSMIRFEILKQTIRKVIETIKELSRAANQAAIDFQTLNIRISSLIATQVRAAGITDDYGESMQIAAGYSQELLNWMQRLALETPVGIDAIAKTVSLSIAMGWGVDAAKELTGAIVDYAAGAGLSNDVMERIIYNFAQMRQAGKVTGTELRDLARGAFLPVNRILDVAAQNLGIAADSMEEFREAAANGSIDVQAFFDAFIQVINTDFPDAARKMNFTFAAVIDNIKDIFKTIIGWNVLAPTIAAIAEPLQNFLNMFRDPEIINFTKLLGLALKDLYMSVKTTFGTIWQSIKSVFSAIFPSTTNSVNGLWGALNSLYENFYKWEGIISFFVKVGGTIQKLGTIIAEFIEDKIVPAAEEIGDKLNSTFEEISSDAFGWGAKLIVNFAAGIARGISTALTWAMNALSSFLSWWLQPGSPPNVAPDIDLWGLGTIAEWLHGFTMADFDVLESIGPALRGSLESLSFLGVIGEDAVLPMFRDISVELIAAMADFNETGTMAESIFERLSSIGGVYGEELATLLQLQLDLAGATERVAIAQEAYNAAVEATRLSTATTNRLIRQYNSLLRGGADEDTLYIRLQEIQAAQMQQDLDQQAELAAQAELEAAEDALDPIREAVQLQEELINQLIELARLQNEIAQSGGGGGGGGGGAAETENPFDPSSLIPTGGGLLPNLEEIFESIRSVALAELEDLWDDLAVLWGDPFAPVEEAWGDLMTNILAVWDVLTEETFPKILEIVELFKNKETGEGGLFSNLFGGGDVVLLTLGDINKGLDKMYDIAKLVRDNWDKVRVALLGIGIILAGWKVGGVLGGVLVLAGIGTTLGAAFSALVPIIIEKLEEIRDNIGTWLYNNILTPIKNFFGITDTAETGSERMAMIGGNIIQGLIDGIYDRVTAFETVIVGWMVEYIIDPIKRLFGVQSPSTMFAIIGADLIVGLANGIIGILETIWETYISEPFNEMVNSVLTFFGVEKDSKTSSNSGIFFDIGTAIIDGFKNGIVGMVTTLWDTYLVEPFNSVVDSIAGFFGVSTGADGNTGPMFTVGADVIQSFINGIGSKVQDVIAAVTEIAGLIPDWISDLLDLHSPSDVMYGMGQNVMQGLINGIEALYDEVVDLVRDLTEDVIDTTDKTLKNGSPSKVYENIGQNMMLGMINGINRSSSEVNDAISSAIGSRLSTGRMSVNASVAAMPVSGGNTVTFGDVYINDRIDLATLKSYVQQMILEN
jgi:tape measure domain-containing protein